MHATESAAPLPVRSRWSTCAYLFERTIALNGGFNRGAATVIICSFGDFLPKKSIQRLRTIFETSPNSTLSVSSTIFGAKSTIIGRHLVRGPRDRR